MKNSTTIDTFESLTAEYSQWLKDNKLPEMSADELVVQTEDGELDGELITTEAQRAWLRNFIERWENAQS